jgi:hypothetical protein
MKTFLVEADSIQRWQAKPGCRILVMGGGAVRFDFPRDWMACANDKYVRIIDDAPPDDRCGLIVSWRHVSPLVTAIPMDYLLREVTLEESETRPIVRRDAIVPIHRHPLEGAWRQMHFIDELQHREACTRVCLARGGRTLATIVFDLWPEDELRLHSAWTTIIETLAVGDYIDDPITGRKREKRG